MRPPWQQDAPYLALRGGAGATPRINLWSKPRTETPIKYLGQIELAPVFSDPGF